MKRKKIIQLRTALLVFLTHHAALPALKKWRNPKAFPYSIEQLMQFEEGTLGYDLFLFLSIKKLSLLTHYVRHDLKHILLSYDTTEEGEVCLQSFMLGNGRISFPVLATLFYGWLTMPEYWSSFCKAFNRGRKSPSINNWNWHLLLTEKTTSLQQIINSNIKINQHGK